MTVKNAKVLAPGLVGRNKSRRDACQLPTRERQFVLARIDQRVGPEKACSGPGNLQNEV